MDKLQDVLELIRRKGLYKGRLRGVFHLAIGRTLAKADGTVLSRGVTWRDLAGVLRDLRFDPEIVRELDIDPETLSPRDRFKFWYSAIGLARISSAEAHAEAEKLAAVLKSAGVIVGSAPAAPTHSPKPMILPTPIEEELPQSKKPTKRKK